MLSAAARGGGGFEELVERHSVALHGYFARRAPHAADDLLAEVWLQAYAARRTYDASRGSARAWLFGVARNVLSTYWRRLAQESRTAPGEGAHGDPWAAVDDRLDASALAPALRRVITELPEVERELLLLVAWEQLSPTEAAAVLGIPAGTARSRLHRARARLRESVALASTSRSPSENTTGEPA
ncbi:RNA polymerase sigma factor [Streptomyces xanthii]|uniref:RNA polymerase sigma factor n=1 Tax=Streptomyces xanthii TaxID=2768069 RepID=A0A7H1BK67_9ACTN|nr:RNA polymerase sigma factor [Streptomyces xanthii]